MMKKKKSTPKLKATQPTSASIQQSFHAAERILHPREREGQIAVVGVGASSGGVESFTQLLSGLPADTGMAFVLVQHLAPDHESLLPSILSRATKMRVFSAQTGMLVEANSVYVIPPNVNVGIINGVLRLIPRSNRNHRPIDFFFRCLADDQSRLSIGIVLSGADSDGAQGLRAIRSQGGLTFVQDPATAKVAAMPINAIAAGGTDSVLSIPGIVDELIHLAKHAFSQPAEQNSLESAGHLAEIIKIVKQRTKIDFGAYKQGLITRRIRRRVLLQQSTSVSKYIEFLKQSGSEVDALCEDFLINVTSFFRDGEIFEHLRTELIPKLLEQHKPETPFRVWVAGCSTGEEVYSIAMILAEVAESQRMHLHPQIFASDLSAAALEQARTGHYHASVVTDVSNERLRRFFTKTTTGYQIIPTLRAQCVFARHDITRDPPFSKMDFVSCRNLLIYFNPQRQKSVMNSLTYAINPGGHLLLGSAETAGHSKYLTVEQKAQRLYRRNADTHRSHFELAAHESSFNQGVPRPTNRPSHSNSELFEQNIREVLVNHFVPAGLLVDSNMQIRQFRGALGDFLEPATGDATLNLFKMARSGLNTELRILMREAEKSRQPTRREAIPYRLNRVNYLVSIAIIPVISNEDANFYLVMFQKVAEANPNQKNIGVKVAKASENLLAVRAELDTTRDYLQSIIREQDYSNEELQSANEEILSSNEELQSTNEELETAKEELQSTNEELVTLNDELQTRNQQLLQANDDLNNLHVSINIPIVMVDTELRIRRFTPSVERLFGVIKTDVGRPIADLRLQLNIENLEQQISETIVDNRVKKLEVLAKGDKKFELRIRPYRTEDGRVNGAVLIFVDLNTTADQGNFLMMEVNQSIVYVDDTFQIVECNLAFTRATNQALVNLVGKSFFEVREGTWNTPVLRALMSEVSAKDMKINDFQIQNFTLSARRLDRAGDVILQIVIDED